MDAIEQDDRLLLRVEEAARLLGLSRSFVFKMVAEGEIPSVRVGRSLRISKASLQQWVQNKVNESPPYQGYKKELNDAE